MKNYKYLLIILFPVVFSCKKFVEVGPPKTQISGSAVFDNDNTAISAITGLYAQMSSTAGNFTRGGIQGFSFLAGLSSDELQSYSNTASQKEFYTNGLTKNNSYVNFNLWGEPYKYIFTANSILEGVRNSANLTQAVRNQLNGEASFIRAFSYFYLLGMFGEVPLVLSTDYTVNSKLARTAAVVLYDQMIADLLVAQSLLPVDYSSYNNERVRPISYTASALLARVYLYKGEYAKAEQLATSVIQSPLFKLLQDPDSVFLKNSAEAIWQLLPVVPGYNTQDGYYFILSNAPTNATIAPVLFNSFETGDKRKLKWINTLVSGSVSYNYPFKYKVKTSGIVTEYSMIMRLAEQFLIRAEARTRLNNLPGARADINLVRLRAGLPLTTATDITSTLLAIEHERQTELFTEWGHRWLDLKRTGRADILLSPVKGANWQTTDVFYPIPQSEINNDPNLTQNPGY